MLIYTKILFGSSFKKIITVTTFDKKNLKQLKKQLQQSQKAEKLAQKQLEQDIQQKTQDDDSFMEAMSGVTPLTHDKAYHEVEKPKAVRPKEFEEELIIHDPLSDELDIEDVDAGEIISFCETGIQKGVFRKLRTGYYAISDELDLHGTTIKQAKQILVYFLQETPQFEGCCIRIIHGKGHRSGNNKPVLKTHVNHWLSEHERVLAFHSAKAKDGGTGAVYVLLKTQP